MVRSRNPSTDKGPSEPAPDLVPKEHDATTFHAQRSERWLGLRLNFLPVDGGFRRAHEYLVGPHEPPIAGVGQETGSAKTTDLTHPAPALALGLKKINERRRRETGHARARSFYVARRRLTYRVA